MRVQLHTQMPKSTVFKNDEKCLIWIYIFYVVVANFSVIWIRTFEITKKIFLRFCAKMKFQFFWNFWAKIFFFFFFGRLIGCWKISYEKPEVLYVECVVCPLCQKLHSPFDLASVSPPYKSSPNYLFNPH